MASQSGAFKSALDNIRNTKPSPDESNKTSAGATQAPKAPTQPPQSPPERRMMPQRKAKTTPFSHRVDMDVTNYFYDLANENNWTMNRTLREAAKALATARGDKEGDIL